MAIPPLNHMKMLMKVKKIMHVKLFLSSLNNLNK